MTFLCEHSEREDVVEALHADSHHSRHNTPFTTLEVDGKGTNATLSVCVETGPDSLDGAFTHLLFPELGFDVHEA